MQAIIALHSISLGQKMRSMKLIQKYVIYIRNPLTRTPKGTKNCSSWGGGGGGGGVRVETLGPDYSSTSLCNHLI